MTVQRLHAHAVVDDHAVAVDAEPARVARTVPAFAATTATSARDRQIEAEMHLLIDFLALVEIGSVIGERGFDL